MAHPKRIDAEAVLQAALELLEADASAGLSIRSVAAKLGVKAPSLYRYFENKAALERAILIAVNGLLLSAMERSNEGRRGEEAFRAMVSTYLQFARTRSGLYFFLTERASEPDNYAEGKALWNFVLGRVGELSGDADDTDGAVAVCSFLHGYAALEHSGRFGKSGPKGGLERGLRALIDSMRVSAARVPSTKSVRDEWL